MLVFAHRGASGEAPENTLASMKKAVAAGAKAVEFDVQLSRDNKLVVIHDYKVDRTTNGKGYVMRKTLEELRKLDAGSWFGEEYAGERIPTLEEVVELLPEDTLLNIEIKSFMLDRRDIAGRVVEAVDELGIEERVIISSFDHKLLKGVRERNREIKIGLLFYGKLLGIEEYKGFKELAPWSIHPSQDYLDEEYLKHLKRTGCRIYSYTVNSKERFKELKNIGLDGIFSDYPEIDER